MRNAPKKKSFSLSGYLIFLATVAAMVTIATSAFVLISRLSEGNTTVIVISMIFVIIAISALSTGIDVFRRKIMIDRPVSALLYATEKIAAGDFSVRLTPLHPYEKYDDYDLIMENLNAMAAELEKSEILKTDFISNISHEIKTPLAIIRSYTSMLATELDEQTRSHYTATVISATKRLGDLVNNILKLNKLENQQLNIEYETFSLDAMLADCILAFEELFEKKGIELECDLDEVSVTSSKSHLEIVWNNLISNAIKFTDEGGRISISLRGGDGFIKVKIADTGCGFGTDVGAHIFDKFYQGDTSHANEGNGLGLSLVKKVIDLLGGEISVKSEVGRGSTFTVVIKGM